MELRYLFTQSSYISIIRYGIHFHCHLCGLQPRHSNYAKIKVVNGVYRQHTPDLTCIGDGAHVSHSCNPYPPMYAHSVKFAYSDDLINLFNLYKSVGQVDELQSPGSEDDFLSCGKVMS